MKHKTIKIFVASAFLWLAIMFALTFGDYLTRPYLPMSRGWIEKDIPVEHGAEHRKTAGH